MDDLAQEFARRLGDGVAKQLGSFINGAKPTRKIEAEIVKPAGGKTVARGAGQYGKAANQHGADSAGQTAKNRDEVSLGDTRSAGKVPADGKVRAGKGRNSGRS